MYSKKLNKYLPFHCVNCALSFDLRDSFLSHLKKIHGYGGKVDDPNVRVKTFATTLDGSGVEHE